MLLLAVSASQKNPVTRPHKGVGQFHVVINVGNPPGSGDLSFVATGVGTGTHTGKFQSYLEGLVTLTDYGPVPTSGTGTITAANGDQLFMEVEPSGSDLITGGKGRFNGATGHFTATNIGDPVVAYDQATGTLTVDATQVIEGTITY